MIKFGTLLGFSQGSKISNFRCTVANDKEGTGFPWSSLGAPKNEAPSGYKGEDRATCPSLSWTLPAALWHMKLEDICMRARFVANQKKLPS